jgi:hypothetical protein
MKITELLLEAKKTRSIVLINNWVTDIYRQDTIFNIQNFKTFIKGPNSKKVIANFQKSLKKEESTLVEIKQIIKDEVALIKRINKECSNYLKVFDETNIYLYRGRRNFEGSVIESESIENRQTLDSSEENTKVYDNTLKLLGIKALRSNSIFTTSKKIMAEGYGDVYVIIPKNTAVYSWSKKYRDLILDYDHNELKSPVYSTKLKKLIHKEIDRLDKNSYNMKLTPNERQYMCVLCDLLEITDMSIAPKLVNWIAKKVPDSPILAFTDEILVPKVDINKFQKKYQVTDKDLPAALKSGHEVLIHGQYFAISIEDFRSFQAMRKQLGYIK